MNLVDEEGGSFGPDRTYRDSKTRRVVSEAYARDAGDKASRLTDRIVRVLKKKAAKAYPAGAVLVANCMTDYMDDREWRSAITRVVNADALRSFKEVFLIDPRTSRSATLAER